MSIFTAPSAFQVPDCCRTVKFGVWAPDGSGFYFVSDRNSSPIFQVFFKRTLESGGTEEQVQPAIPFPVHDISHDGRWLLLSRLRQESRYGLMVADLRAKTEVAQIEARTVARTKAAAAEGDRYVRDHPWQAVGIAGAIGLLVGFLMRRD